MERADEEEPWFRMFSGGTRSYVLSRLQWILIIELRGSDLKTKIKKRKGKR